VRGATVKLELLSSNEPFDKPETQVGGIFLDSPRAWADYDPETLRDLMLDEILKAGRETGSFPREAADLIPAGDRDFGPEVSG
jgi:hypothetical protein